MDNRSSKAKPTQPSSHQGSETLLGPTRRDARSVLHHPYEALSKAHHYQHQHHYRHHHHYLRHERYLHSPASNSSEVWTLPPSPHSSASTSASSLAKTAEWLRWLIHSAAVSSLEGVPNDNTRKLMLLDLPVDGSCTGAHSRSEFDRMPGIRYYNQGTEETTGRTMPSAATAPRPSQTTTTKNHNNANSNNGGGNNNNKSNNGNSNNGNNISNNSNSNKTNTRSSANPGQSPHQHSGSRPSPLTPSSWSSQPPTPPSPPSSFNRSTVNSATIAAAARNARNRGESEDKSASSSSSSSGRPNRGSSSSSTGSTATVGAGTPTSALLFSTSQEFHQVWSQTTAFLHRTFSPTYRVSHLYWDSWTNGTQRRGLERLKTSVLRGDAFRLMQNTTVQLRNLWNRSIAESRAHASEIERQAKAFEEKTRKIQERAFGKSSSSSSSSSTPTPSSASASSETGHSQSNQNSATSSNGNKTEGGQEKPRN